MHALSHAPAELIVTNEDKLHEELDVAHLSGNGRQSKEAAGLLGKR